MNIALPFDNDFNISAVLGTYSSWKVDRNTWFITFVNGTQYAYLLEGKENALLIDTGWGYGNIRDYVEQLTDKPILVTNTHGHSDHSGGNGWWPEVYRHPEAKSDIDHLQAFDVSTLPHPNYKSIPISEGYTFDLGGRTVTVIELGGHSKSGLAFWDNQGYLFCGDELESGQVLLVDYTKPFRLLETRAKDHLTAMEKIVARLDEISLICPAHNGAPISKEYVFDFMELDRQIAKGIQPVFKSLKHDLLSQSPTANQLRRTQYQNASFIYKL